MSDATQTLKANEALREAVRLAGSQIILSARASQARGNGEVLTQQCISKWLTKGLACNPTWAAYIAEAVDWKITPHELCPDAFPPALMRVERIQQAAQA